MTPDTVAAVERLFALRCAEAPEGSRVELLDGEIHVTPLGTGLHASTVSELVEHSWQCPDPVLLVAEVTSAATASRDRGLKNRVYARGGIPLYLVVDKEADEVVVCSEPEGDDYTHKSIHKLGAEVPLPAPLGFTLDTAEF
ncbi:Uma2 family endonuclease [Streptomyces sp. NPDC058486]|uniref:Uma2 family endonuclease n=1 Tax=unclassified Streptomyces TaxID=2593676 RepID=UPI003656E143